MLPSCASLTAIWLKYKKMANKFCPFLLKCQPTPVTLLLWAWFYRAYVSICNIWKNTAPFLVTKWKRHVFQNENWLLYACILSFNSGKLRPFIWHFENVFCLHCKLSAYFKVCMQFVDLHCLMNFWESLSAVLGWMHTEVQVTPLVFSFTRTKLFYCCEQNLSISRMVSVPFFTLLTFVSGLILICL